MSIEAFETWTITGKLPTDMIRTEIEARMANGVPFTFTDLWGPYGKEGYRVADRAIQRWRKAGKIKMDGRNGRSPLWVFTPTQDPNND